MHVNIAKYYYIEYMQAVKTDSKFYLMIITSYEEYFEFPPAHVVVSCDVGVCCYASIVQSVLVLKIYRIIL